MTYKAGSTVMVEGEPIAISGNSILELECEINGLVRDLRESQEQLLEAQQAIVDLEEQAQALQEDFDDVRVENEGLINQNAGLEERLENSEAALKNTLQDVEDLGLELDNANEKVEALEEQVDACDSIISASLRMNRRSVYGQMLKAASMVRELLDAIEVEDATRSAGVGVERAQRERAEIVARLSGATARLDGRTGSRTATADLQNPPGWIDKTMVAESLRLPFLELEREFMQIASSRPKLSDLDVQLLWNAVRRSVNLRPLAQNEVVGKLLLLARWSAETP